MDLYTSKSLPSDFHQSCPLHVICCEHRVTFRHDLVNGGQKDNSDVTILVLNFLMTLIRFQSVSYSYIVYMNLLDMTYWMCDSFKQFAHHKSANCIDN